MWYFSKDVIDLSSAKEISFNFKHSKVERCGIRLLCLQDAVEYGIISKEFVHEESNKLQSSGFHTVDRDIDDEPHPKRIKFFNFE